MRRYPELKGLVLEASRALAGLEASRLEELALCCQALNRDVDAGLVDRSDVAREARGAVAEMESFRRVLQGTRENLGVMARLRDLRMGRLEYREQTGGWTSRSSHGNH